MRKRALMSVSDKTGLAPFASELADLGYEIVSTGGTLRTLLDAGIPAVQVADITGFPEILDGRVKTLHPYIHGGLLAKQDDENHMAQLNEGGIEPFQLVCVNLYPFKETLQQSEATSDEMIEQIDIGGPAMLRASAKNFASLTVVVDPADYDQVLEHLKNSPADLETRKRLAAKVFSHTAHYDAMIAGYFNDQIGNAFPETLTVTYEKSSTLRYGENPHQAAAFYQTPIAPENSLARANQLNGKALSYNNIQDADAALAMLREYEVPAAVAVKHMNPCGIGCGDDLNEAFEKAYNSDPVSIFGGIVAVNREVTADLADQLSKIFLEIVIAPQFTDEALAILTQKKNIRLLELPMTEHEEREHLLKSVTGGLLVQDADQQPFSRDDAVCVTDRQPTEAEWEDLMFAWKAVKHVKSNAIVLAKDGQTIGIGAGQMNRVGAAKIALEQAEEKAEGAVMGSDAFFPMPDTVETAAAAGITAIIQPGGSKRDQDSIDACNTHDIAMIHTGMRHFKH
ncbi:Phosphoribosylaminoimidazolecarboxamide formyltransferase [Lentibacillus sp. JNUCC-1]|uniref:bifunctional phosphoribosylaminoimidazolecarboxamide formyltransferase/IMP cyclohydrolase n=1 Tax=Lentibacillus sp. JNUCC-1 TaxID=2654513 RepID=UPI0012E77894|nr:bifunctional phosphoribosylaminoimidazolecarboxamide formyltransferase/IMP cyclohydrolase [Lentibacillus sp. JNUCC-1]MUV38588.1 Phosphoribosylaminoimidazolecarboxamide formyltransferase [Lentibacillus sp. JNUCC-1]